MMPPSRIDAQPVGTFWLSYLDQPLPVGLVPRLPVVFMQAGSEDARQLAQAMQLDNPALVLQRFARGCHCYIGWVEDKLVTYGWVTFDEESIGELGMSFRLPAGEAYIWDCATLPAYRGQRLYPVLLKHILNELHCAGLRRVWIGTDTGNHASQSGLALAGFHPVVDVIINPVLAKPRPLIRGRPGVPEQIVNDVRHALSGNRDQP